MMLGLRRLHRPMLLTPTCGSKGGRGWRGASGKVPGNREGGGRGEGSRSLLGQEPRHPHPHPRSRVQRALPLRAVRPAARAGWAGAAAGGTAHQQVLAALALNEHGAAAVAGEALVVARVLAVAKVACSRRGEARQLRRLGWGCRAGRRHRRAGRLRGGSVRRAEQADGAGAAARRGSGAGLEGTAVCRAVCMAGQGRGWAGCSGCSGCSAHVHTSSGPLSAREGRATQPCTAPEKPSGCWSAAGAAPGEGEVGPGVPAGTAAAGRPALALRRQATLRGGVSPWHGGRRRSGPGEQRRRVRGSLRRRPAAGGHSPSAQHSSGGARIVCAWRRAWRWRPDLRLRRGM